MEKIAIGLVEVDPFLDDALTVLWKGRPVAS
jgi:hypothetical protein